MIDPDEEVAAAVADVFTAFTATGSAYGVVAAFTSRRFPRRAYGGAWAGQVRFDRLTHRVLDPVQPGLRRRLRLRPVPPRRTVRPDGRARSPSSCPGPWGCASTTTTRATSTGTRSWPTSPRLAANRTNAGARPPREGAALCQGIVFCGCCGRSMSTRYAGAHPGHECAHSRADHVATPAAARCAPPPWMTRWPPRCWPRWPPINSPWPWPPRTRSPPAASGRSGPRSWPSNVPATKPNARAGVPGLRTGEPAGRPQPGGPLGGPPGRPRTDPDHADRRAPGPDPAAPPAELAAAVADMQTLWNAPSTSDKDRKRRCAPCSATSPCVPATRRASCGSGCGGSPGPPKTCRSKRLSAVTDGAARHRDRRVGPRTRAWDEQPRTRRRPQRRRSPHRRGPRLRHQGRLQPAPRPPDRLLPPSPTVN